MKKSSILKALAAASCLALSSCGLVQESANSKSEADKWKFGMDLSFLEKYAEGAIVLGEGESYVAISPKLQGRVMTSTLGGDEGYSIGWINRDLIASGNSETHLKNFGGEDRLWIGPEGTELSVFFGAGDLFVGDNWRIPADLSKEPWELKARTNFQARLEKEANLENARGEKFKVRAMREISYISKANAAKILGVEIPESVRMVAFQSLNRITNLSEKTWSAETGILNLSVMSCFHANASTYAFIPYNPGAPEKIGGIIKDPYNESVGGDRLSIAPDYVRMRVDGTKLGEITMNPNRSKGIIGSYDSERNILTVITYIRPASPKKYLPANWRRTNDLFEGDALSVFNNGPAHQGTFKADKFYETSTYSPAIALEPGKSQLHVQRIFHFEGSEYELGLLSEKLLGIPMSKLRP